MEERINKHWSWQSRLRRSPSLPGMTRAEFESKALRELATTWEDVVKGILTLEASAPFCGE